MKQSAYLVVIVIKQSELLTKSYIKRCCQSIRHHEHTVIILLYITVPIPNVTVTVPNTQIVGQSLTLQCEVTTVRGITSRVDIVWSSNGTELERMNDVSSTTMDNSLVYTDSYTILQLSTTDESRVIQCEIVINASPSVMASDSITLDVTGECYVSIIRISTNLAPNN